ncbi:MAG: hypothetical protein PVJ04_04185 [Gemmatimonadota bacterium]|jgi:hypothetical protein
MATGLEPIPSELKRRKVTRVAVAYSVAGMGVAEGATVSWRPYGHPDLEWERLGNTPMEWAGPR